MIVRFRMAGAIIMNVVYGMDIESEDGTSYFKVAEAATDTIAEIEHAGSFLGTPSAFLRLYIFGSDVLVRKVDLFPVCEYNSGGTAYRTLTGFLSEVSTLVVSGCHV